MAVNMQPVSLYIAVTLLVYRCADCTAGHVMPIHAVKQQGLWWHLQHWTQSFSAQLTHHQLLSVSQHSITACVTLMDVYNLKPSSILQQHVL